MHVVEQKTKLHREVRLMRVSNTELSKIPKSRFYFNWTTERDKLVLKLMLETEGIILGLVSVSEIWTERRLEINLLAVSKENRGQNKMYDGIAGNLIAAVCRESIKRWGEHAFISLIPKRSLKMHYMKTYGFKEVGFHLFLAGKPLFELVKNTNYEHKKHVKKIYTSRVGRKFCFSQN